MRTKNGKRRRDDRKGGGRQKNMKAGRNVGDRKGGDAACGHEREKESRGQDRRWRLTNKIGERLKDRNGGRGGCRTGKGGGGRRTGKGRKAAQRWGRWLKYRKGERWLDDLKGDIIRGQERRERWLQDRKRWEAAGGYENRIWLEERKLRRGG